MPAMIGYDEKINNIKNGEPKPVVSVIVPFHNTEPFLQACIQSIIAQSFGEWELILVDDRAADTSRTVAEQACAADPRITLIKSCGEGVSEARNTGIEKARGEYISFVDADDALAPRALEILMEACSAPECDIAVGRFASAEAALDDEPQGASTLVPSAEAIVRTLYQQPGYHESAWAKLFRRSLFDDASLRFVAGRRYEDLEITPRIYAHARSVAYVPAAIYFYRLNPESFIRTWSASRADALFATESIVRFITTTLPEALPAALSRRFSAAFNVFNLAVKYKQAALCTAAFAEIKALRGDIVRDSRSRLRNRLAALMSYAGMGVCKFAARLSRTI